MTSFAELLNARHADTEAVLQLMRLWVGVKSDDTPLDEQWETLIKVLRGQAEMERVRTLLYENPQLLEALCLLVLSRAWEQPGEKALIEEALAGAEGKLPVTDRLMLTVAVMYAMYLLASGGGSDIHQTTVRDSNGMFHQEQVITHAPFAPAIDPLLRMFGLEPHGSNRNISTPRESARSSLVRNKLERAARPPEDQRGSKAAIRPAAGRKANAAKAMTPPVSSRLTNFSNAAASRAPVKLKVTTSPKASPSTECVDKAPLKASAGKTKARPRERR